MRPVAIGLDVFERDPFTFVTYPLSPTLLPTDNSSCEDVDSDKLYYRMKCEEVYVSPCCVANKPILERDSPGSDRLLSVIKGSGGDITDLTKRIHYTQKSIRLAIIDYARLSTSPDDIRNFLDTYPNIKKIAIDHGKSIEILTQHKLLERNDVEKFNCRPGPVQLSK